jgi:hypothetical protein
LLIFFQAKVPLGGVGLQGGAGGPMFSGSVPGMAWVWQSVSVVMYSGPDEVEVGGCMKDARKVEEQLPSLSTRFTDLVVCMFQR